MKLKEEKGISVIGILLFIAIIVVVCLLVARTFNLFGENETGNNNVVTEEVTEVE